MRARVQVPGEEFGSRTPRLLPGRNFPGRVLGGVPSFGRLVVLLVVAGVAAVGVRVLFVQSFVIPSSSMQPLLAVGDRVLVWRLDRRVGDLRRGDVIVFNGQSLVANPRPSRQAAGGLPPGSEGAFEAPASPAGSRLAAAGRTVAGALGAPIGEYDYVARVVGLPGEWVACCDARGRVTVDGRPLGEPYVQRSVSPGGRPFEVRVPAGRLLVIGDNRDDSDDSPTHRFGPGGGTVPLDHVVGRVVSVWWPWSRATGIGRTDA